MITGNQSLSFKEASTEVRKQADAASLSPGYVSFLPLYVEETMEEDWAIKDRK